MPRPAPKPSTSSVPLAAIGELQSQLQETQNALTSYSDKFHILDSLITEHDGFEHDVDLIKVAMEEQRNKFLNATTTPAASPLSLLTANPRAFSRRV